MNKSIFLPEDYEAPKSSGGYMKLQDGENKIRILSAPIMGWEDWENNKPIRFTMDNKPVKPINPKMAVRHFWAMIVWNYNEERIQILHITQAGVRKAIEALCKDEDFGAPYFYDIKIRKEGKMKETQYFVTPLSFKPVADHIKQAFFEKPCNLKAILDNQDPFALGQDEYTQGVFEDSAPIEDPDLISQLQAHEIDEILNDCDPSYVVDVKKTWARLGFKTSKQMPKHHFEKYKRILIDNRNSYQDKLKKSEAAIGF